MIIVVDFGSQTAHLISRRIKELGAKVLFLPPEEAFLELKKNLPAGRQGKKIKGIILSGGPSSVYSKNSPTINSSIFNMEIPVLGICYGFQLMVKLLGGEVREGKKEYGPATINLEIRNSKFEIAKGLPGSFVVWMSHGDEILKLPKGFEVLGSSDSLPFALSQNTKKNFYGLLFHPEVEHTENGNTVLNNFLEICSVDLKRHKIDEKEMIKSIRDKVGNYSVIGAVSGGVDSTVAAILTAKAIGENFYPIYVDNGLMREGTELHLNKIFKHIGIRLDVLKVEKEMLKRLKNISDPEEKRKIIGNFYIELFEKEMGKLVKMGKKIKFLLQGTIYSDVIESQGTKHSDKIKSHHNVGGLPKNMKLQLLEPLRNLYKDEVRELGQKLGLPEEFVNMQPFPGPGYAIRIRGEVTPDRLNNEKIADKIVLEELKNANLYEKVFISFPVLTNSFSTAVKGDGRVFGEVVALRIVESKDVMTSDWAKIPYEVLQRISSRIVNEVPGISRVVYDITTKPPATMEWE
ncbi:MAG: glutamine-hydrolyzing GMP synthase [Patescibacteria group bacterium]